MVERGKADMSYNLQPPARKHQRNHHAQPVQSQGLEEALNLPPQFLDPPFP